MSEYPSPVDNALYAVVVAAGNGTRLDRKGLPKAYQNLCGQTILERTIQALCACDALRPAHIQIVISSEHEAHYRALTHLPDGLPEPCFGGADRSASVRCGVARLNLSAQDRVLIHDAARPFVDTAMIERMVDGLASHPVVIPTLPIADALKHSDALDSADRSAFCLAQTPQGFRYHALQAAYAVADDVGSDIDYPDEAALCFAADIVLHAVAGSVDNFKITYPEDLMRGAQQLSQTVFGWGVDLHRMDIDSAPQKIAIGGLQIDHQFGLVGHSDGDVVLHALVDAILGTIAGGDIGQHFPPSDPQWKDQDSRLFLETALQLLYNAGASLQQVDITVIADAPKIDPHRDAMQTLLANMLNLNPNHIGIKATTTEGRGFIDAREAIAAQVMITVLRPKS